jgi:uncharacterized protein (TIGR00369 family)
MAAPSAHDPDQALLARIAEIWNARAEGLISHMNLKIEEPRRDSVRIRMPFNPDFTADEEQTLIHGGILTALLDSAFGLANFLAVENVETMATLDLRVEYLRPAAARADVMVEAECYHQTRHVVFNSGRVWLDIPGRPEVARALAAFLVTRGEGMSFLEKLATGGPGA